MRTKEEYYLQVLENRRILQNPDNLKCPCPKIKCEWHGNCQACTALHRYHKDHVPNCFQQFINDRLKAVVEIGELKAIEKEQTPSEYRDYVKEQDEISKEK